MPDENRDRTTRFLIELRDLLDRYDASIECECDEASDMHGVFGEKTGIAFSDDRFHDRLSIEIADFWGVDVRALDEVIEKRNAVPENK